MRQGLLATQAALIVASALAAWPVMAQESAPVAPAVAAADWRVVPADNLLVIDTSKGRILVEMAPEVAPGHVARIRMLAKAGFYDGVPWHRVIDGFMAQTGDVQFGKQGSETFNPGRAGMGGSSKPDLKAEFSATSHIRGTCSMARSQNPNSANSQFFICFADAPWLNKQYSVWGQVISGMDFVDQIKRGEPVKEPDSIVSARVAADV